MDNRRCFRCFTIGGGLFMTYQQRRRFRQLETWGVAFTCLTGLLLHFSYRLSGGAVWSILFGAANGSVWETVKIMALPYLCWSIVELCFLRLPLKNFVVARVTGLYVMSLGTIAFRFLYAGIFGTSYAWVDILGFAAFTALGFWVSSRVMDTDSNKIRPWFTAAAFAMALFIAMYLTFTVNPPHISLFLDPATGIYGIPPRNLDAGAVYLDALKDI